MKTKIEIKSVLGKVLFEFEKENNSIKETLLEAIKQKIDLRGSNLSYSDLRYSDLRGSNLRYSNLRYSDLRYSDLRYSDLRYSNLRYSDLRGSNLRYSNLIGSNLSGSDLSGSDLRGSNLRGSDLNGSDTDKRYIQISCIGSAKRLTTYCFEDDKIWCGCFTGTLEEFKKQVKETHDNNPQYLAEYLLFVEYLKSLKMVGE